MSMPDRREPTGAPSPHITHRRRRGLLRGLSLVTAGLLLAACGGAQAGPEAAPDAPEQRIENQLGKTRKGGSVTMLLTGLSARFDPLSSPAFGFTTGAAMNAIYGLLSYNEAATNEIKMGFLESLTPDAEAKVWTATLRPGLKFSDGTDFDAAAIEFNIKRAADPANGGRFYYQAKDLVTEVVDATTLKITLPAPNVHFDAVFTESFAYVASPTAVRERGEAFGTNPVGAGPFKVVSYESATKLVLEPNPYYEIFAPGEPRLDSLTFETVSEFPRQLQAISAGQAQMSAPYGGDAIRMFQQQTGLQVFVNQTGAGSSLQMSLNRPPFDDPRAREAISLALDRTALANAFHPGTAPQTNLFPSSWSIHDPQFDYPEQNRERAQQLFDELAAEGKPVEFTYTVPDQAQPIICAQLVQSQLASFRNVKVELKTLPTPQYAADQWAGNYQMIPSGLYLINAIPSLPDYLVTGGSLNTTGYSNPAVDSAVQQLMTQSDETAQREALAVVQREMLADNPVYWVGQGIIGFALSEQLTGIVPVNYGNTLLWGQLGYKE